jgi:histidinol-phosphate aminotransferase
MSLPIRNAILTSPDYPFSFINAKVKLDQNESSDDFPAALKVIALERMRRAAWNRYPDLHSESLCASIAQYEGWSPSGVVVTTGSNVLIALLIQLTALNGRVVTVKPNFALYGLDAKLLGSTLTEVPLREDFSLDVDAVIDALGSSDHAAASPAGVIYVARPHAPTGSLSSLDDMERLAKASNWLLVIDEAYHQFAQTKADEIAKRFPHVVLLRTFSKAWGLAGLRLGYALTSDEVARQLRKLVPPFGTSVMQTVCAQVALENPAYMHEHVAGVIRERERMADALKQHPSWTVIPSAANFLLIRTPDAAKAYAALLAHGVLVRRQDSHFRLEGCIRVTVGNRAENDAFLKAASACTD